jgi:hypothetical protein
MSDPILESYLQDLRHALRRRGLFDSRLIDEAQEHLLDLIADGARRGLSREIATQEALRRFGEPELLARQAFAQRCLTTRRVLMGVAVLIGLLLAYVDSRPTWDDNGILAGAMLLSAALLGFAAPYRPWVWALAIGAGIAGFHVTQLLTPGTLFGSVLILGFPMCGAYAGMLCRRALAGMMPSRP